MLLFLSNHRLIKKTDVIKMLKEKKNHAPVGRGRGGARGRPSTSAVTLTALAAERNGDELLTSPTIAPLFSLHRPPRRAVLFSPGDRKQEAGRTVKG